MPPERDIDEHIRKHLVVLAYEIENANERNLQDINIYSEGTCAEMLNLVWDTNLLELNREVVANYPAIDLLDEAEGLFIQVTSDDSLEKIRHTLKKAKNLSAEKGFEIKPKIVLLKFNKPRRSKTFTVYKEKETEITFENSNVICLNELAHLMQNQKTERKSEILEYLRERITLVDTSRMYSVEVYTLKKFFESLSSISHENTGEQSFAESELDKKRELYKDFWTQIQMRYKAVLDRQREKSFKTAFDRIGQADRLRLTQYLSIESIKVLDEIGEANPNEVIDRLKDKIIQEIHQPLISEIDVIHFLYYEFHHCNVLPIYEEAIA